MNMRAQDHTKGLSRFETSKLKKILISIIVSPATYNELAKNVPFRIISHQREGNIMVLVIGMIVAGIEQRMHTKSMVIR